MGLHGRFYKVIARLSSRPMLAAGSGLVPAASRNFPGFEHGNHRFRAGLFLQPTALRAPSETRSKHEVLDMLSWVVTFLIIALIAGILGFGGLAGASIEIAKIIFFIAVVLFLLSAVVGLARGRTRV
jgi:uncharacterized membrane protein YtjA (UPF0391 family)